MTRRAADDDIRALVEAITPIYVGPGSTYTALDRYRDFHRVFHGTPEGKRVLSQVIGLLEGQPILEADLEKPHLLAAREWARRQGQRIMAWASIPPREQVVTGRKKG